MNARIVLALLLLGPALAADEDRGILLTRDAQQLLAQGRAAEAVTLLKLARVEWPDSPIVSQTLADAQLALGQWTEALAEYERGSQDGYEHRSRFNSGVTLDRMAEEGLSAASVPLDPAGLGPGPQPELLAAIEESLPVLERARVEFLRALDRQPGAAARESIGAVNRRIDDLGEMLEELQRRQDEQEQQQGEDGDEQDQDPNQEQQQGDQDQQQEPGDQADEDQPQDQPQDEPQDGEGEESQDDEPQPAQDEAPGELVEPRLLSREEVQQLLEKLDELEKEGRQLRKLREAARRRTVEKDW